MTGYCRCLEVVPNPIHARDGSRVTLSEMQFSPRLHSLLVEQIWSLDDGRRPIAEIWRGVSREAGEVGLAAPGYHTVRTVVRAERLRRAERSEALRMALKEATRYTPDGLRVIDHVGAAHRRRRRAPARAVRAAETRSDKLCRLRSPQQRGSRGLRSTLC